MSNASLGSLEEIVLLMVLSLDGNAYSVTLVEEYHKYSKKKISVPAMHTVLKQLETKGFVESKIGGATNERGGRSKRIYSITKSGYEMVTEANAVRQQLWKLAPEIKFT